MFGRVTRKERPLPDRRHSAEVARMAGDSSGLQSRNLRYRLNRIIGTDLSEQTDRMNYLDARYVFERKKRNLLP